MYIKRTRSRRIRRKIRKRNKAFENEKKDRDTGPFFDGNLLADAVVTAAAAEEKQKDNPAAAIVAVK